MCCPCTLTLFFCWCGLYFLHEWSLLHCAQIIIIINVFHWFMFLFFCYYNTRYSIGVVTLPFHTISAVSFDKDDKIFVIFIPFRALALSIHFLEHIKIQCVQPCFTAEAFQSVVNLCIQLYIHSKYVWCLLTCQLSAYNNYILVLYCIFEILYPKQYPKWKNTWWLVLDQTLQWKYFDVTI